jgi:hypothetical protein
MPAGQYCFSSLLPGSLPRMNLQADEAAVALHGDGERAVAGSGE